MKKVKAKHHQNLKNKCFEKVSHIDNYENLYAKCIYEQGYIFKLLVGFIVTIGSKSVIFTTNTENKASFVLDKVYPHNRERIFNIIPYKDIRMTRIILKLILIASLSGCFLIPPYSKIEAPIQALSQDVSVSITYGEQKSVETQHSEGNKVEKTKSTPVVRCKYYNGRRRQNST